MTTPSKILVIQLTRFGDILLTIPTLNGLRRNFPDAQIDFLVRSRFRHSCELLNSVNSIYTLDGRNILQPLLENSKNIQVSDERLKGLLESLRAQGYTHIFNLSFSPVSSYIQYYLTKGDVVARGYTRHSDGFLSLPDDISAYFHAQVGIGSKNRFHVADLMAQICGINLQPSDWISNVVSSRERSGIAIHMGASQKFKTLSPQKWYSCLSGLLRKGFGPLVLIGSTDEQAEAESICAKLADQRIRNCVGRTTFAQLAETIQSCQLLIGGDSAPIHVAALTGTPCLNISLKGVNFWETGPQALGSRVMVIEDEADLASDQMVAEVESMLQGGASPIAQWIRDNESDTGYSPLQPASEEYSWELIKAIYLNEKFPIPANEKIEQALYQILELCILSHEQTQKILIDRSQTTSLILDRIDESMAAVMKLVPDITPLIKWYFTEKVRQGPLPLFELVETNLRLLEQLHALLVCLLHLTDAQGERDKAYGVDV